VEGLLLSRPASSKDPEKLYFIKRDGARLESRYGKVGSKDVGACNSQMPSSKDASGSYQEAIQTKISKGYLKVKELSSEHKAWLGLAPTKHKTDGKHANNGKDEGNGKAKTEDESKVPKKTTADKEDEDAVPKKIKKDDSPDEDAKPKKKKQKAEVKDDEDEDLLSDR